MTRLAPLGLVLLLGLGPLPPAPTAHADGPFLSEGPTLAELLAREEELLARVRAVNPERHADLLRLKARDESAYAFALARVARMVDRAADGEAAHPELAAIRARFAELERAYPDGLAGLPKKEQQQVRRTVTELAEQIFEIKQTERRRRLEEARAKLAELEAEISRRDAERDALIEAFVDQALRGRVDL